MIYEFLNYPENLHVLVYIVEIFQRDTHFHSGMEILYIMEGSVIIIKGNTTELLKEGDIYVIEPKMLHSLKETDQRNSILVVQFDTKFCDSYFPNFPDFCIRRSRISPEDDITTGGEGGYASLKEIIGEFLQCQERKGPSFPFHIMSMLNRLCAVLIDEIGMDEIPEEEAEARKRNLVRIGRIIDYVNKNYMYKITLKQLAEHENLNMCYLSHFITRNLGMSFQKYLTQVRTQSAVELLLSSNKRVIDICIECGFSDSRYLNKAFMEQYGMTPLQFKKKRGDQRRNGGSITSIIYGTQTEQHRITSIEDRIEQIIEKL